MTMLTIYPYRLGPCWVFDDARTGLKEEAFVLGSSEVLTRLVEAKKLPKAVKGFALHFGDEPFDGFDAEKIARYGDTEIAALLANPRIVRNRLKVLATITNAFFPDVAMTTSNAVAVP